MKCNRCTKQVGRGGTPRMCAKCVCRARLNNKSRYARLRLAGLCGACGKTKPAEGLTQCRKCLDKIRGFNKKLRDKRNRERTCTTCGLARRSRGYRTCVSCLRKESPWTIRSFRHPPQWWMQDCFDADIYRDWKKARAEKVHARELANRKKGIDRFSALRAERRCTRCYKKHTSDKWLCGPCGKIHSKRVYAAYVAKRNKQRH